MYLNKNELFEAALAQWEKVAVVTVAVSGKKGTGKNVSGQNGCIR